MPLEMNLKPFITCAVTGSGGTCLLYTSDAADE